MTFATIRPLLNSSYVFVKSNETSRFSNHEYTFDYTSDLLDNYSVVSIERNEKGLVVVLNILDDELDGYSETHSEYIEY